MKIITSVLQLVPALLWQVGVSHLLQAAKGSTPRDSGIQEVRIHCGATGAVFPERGFRDPVILKCGLSKSQEVQPCADRRSC